MSTRFFDGAQECAGDDRFTADMFMRKQPAVIDDDELLSDLRDVCASCPLLAGCDEWALNHERHGFWAGRTPLERVAVRQEKGIRLVEPMTGLVVVEVALSAST